MTNKDETKPGATILLLALAKQHYWMTIALLLVSLAAFFGIRFLYQTLAIDGQHQQASNIALLHSQSQVAIVNEYFAKQTNTFSAFISRPSIASTLIKNDRKKIHNMEKLLNNLSPDALENRIITPNDPWIKTTTNFAAKEMVITAQGTLSPPIPEAVKLNSGWAFVLVFPITSTDNQYAGTLITTLKPTTLLEKLSRTRLPGKTSLLQKLPGIPPKRVVSAGKPAPLNIKHVSTTAYDHWTIEFEANHAIYAKTSINLSDVRKIIWSIAAIYILLLILIIRRAAPNFRSQMATLQQAKRNSPDTSHHEQDSFLTPPPSSNPTVADDASQQASTTTTEETTAVDAILSEEAFPTEVFREYDIRGIAKTQITSKFAYQLGKALGTMLNDADEKNLITAYDGRLSSPELHNSLARGLLSSGCNILHIGAQPTPVMNFTTHYSQQANSGVMITASHNPAEYNGFKICLNQKTATREQIQQLATLMAGNKFHVGEGSRMELDITNNYISAIKNDIVPSHGLKIVVDAGNGIAGGIAPTIANQLGCKVIRLFCDIDGRFPNRQPDTSNAENLQQLIATVKEEQADMGIALDGDGDRVVAVSPSGKIIWPDEILMIFAKDVLSRFPGTDIVFDVKSTRRLNSVISSYGGRPVMCKTGHSNMRTKIEECDAPLGGEYSGHIFFKDRWFGFDDGIYAMARLIELVTSREQNLDEIMATFDQAFSSPEIKIAIPEDEKFTLMEKIIEETTFDPSNLSTLDGLRVDYPKGWGLIRASNTTPALTLRFEAVSEEALERLQSLFRDQLRSIDSRLTF